MSKEINELTDDELDILVASEELKCKIDPKTGQLKCATSDTVNRAIARLRNPVKQVVFEVTSIPAEPEVRQSRSAEPVNES